MSIIIYDPIINVPIRLYFENASEEEYIISEDTKLVWDNKFNINKEQSLVNIITFKHIKFIADKYIYICGCDICNFSNIIKVFKKLINISKKNFGCIFIYFLFFPIKPIYINNLLIELFGALARRIKYSFVKSSDDIIHIFEI